MFDNIKALRLTIDPTTDIPIATAMISTEGEVMEFRYNGKSTIGDEKHRLKLIFFSFPSYSANEWQSRELDE